MSRISNLLPVLLLALSACAPDGSLDTFDSASEFDDDTTTEDLDELDSAEWPDDTTDRAAATCSYSLTLETVTATVGESWPGTDLELGVAVLGISGTKSGSATWDGDLDVGDTATVGTVVLSNSVPVGTKGKMSYNISVVEKDGVTKADTGTGSGSVTGTCSGSGSKSISVPISIDSGKSGKVTVGLKLVWSS